VRRKRLSPADEHIAWLAGRLPSEALTDFGRTVDDSPLGRFAEQHCRAIALRRKVTRLKATGKYNGDA
jgi:hypothetical protein